MDNNIHNVTQEKTGSWIDSPLAKIGGALAAVGFTIATARHAVASAFFKSVNKADAFTDLQKTRDDANREVFKKALHEPGAVDVMTETRRIQHGYDLQLAERMEKLGMNGFWKRWNTLKKHQKMEAVFATSAVAGLAVGAILTINSNRDISRKQDELDTPDGKQGMGR